jgi:hypothetical protein
MSLIEPVFLALLGEPPKPYNWREDARARPNHRERESLPVHVDECTLRQIEIKQMFAQSRIDRYNDRKILLAIVAVSLASGAGTARELLSLILP